MFLYWSIRSTRNSFTSFQMIDQDYALTLTEKGLWNFPDLRTDLRLFWCLVLAGNSVWTDAWSQTCSCVCMYISSPVTSWGFRSNSCKVSWYKSYDLIFETLWAIAALNWRTIFFMFKYWCNSTYLKFSITYHHNMDFIVDF